MRILIDGGSLQGNRLNAEKSEIISHCLGILTKKNGDADWLVLVDGSRPQDRLSDLQVERREVKNPVGGILGRKLWVGWRIPSISKEFRAALLMTFNGEGAPRAGIPQCSWIPEHLSGKGARIPVGVRSPEALFTFSQKQKEWLIEKSGRPGEGVFVIYGGPGEDFLPLSWVEKEKAKISFAAGKEYFLVFFTGLLPEDLVNILKGFSLFKKRQQSNMQLVFTGLGEPGIDFTQKLQRYKYREDIHIQGNLPGSAESKLVAAAYAVVLPFAKEATGLRVLNAFQAGVPVITGIAGCQAEVAGEAALYAEPGEPAALADQLMAVFKDENLRNRMINNGITRLERFSWEKSSQRLWEGILYSLRDY